jgi:methylated-DNA-[protein]-cysteine S-methyltransferase
VRKRFGNRPAAGIKEKTLRTYTVVDSPLGPLTLAARDGALSGLYLTGHKRRPDPAELGSCTTQGFDEAARQLEEYFAGDRRTFELPLAPAGNSFAQRVWQKLQHIPYGQTRSYGELAEEFGGRGFAQAVGAANGRNPLCIVVPCHRVIGADGQLVGYAGGLDRKEFLLRLENPAWPPNDTLF